MAGGTAPVPPATTAKVPPLTDDERAMVERHTGLVWTVAARFFRGVAGPDRDDLLGEGLFALSRAVQLFDPALGFKPSTYFCKTIYRRMMRAWRARPLIRIPASSGEPPLPVVSFDALAGGTEGDTSFYYPASRESAPDADPAGDLARVERAAERALQQLQPRQAAAVRLRVMEGMKLREIGERLGVTRERVRQILRQWLPTFRAAVHEGLGV